MVAVVVVVVVVVGVVAADDGTIAFFVPTSCVSRNKAAMMTPVQAVNAADVSNANLMFLPTNLPNNIGDKMRLRPRNKLKVVVAQASSLLER